MAKGVRYAKPSITHLIESLRRANPPHTGDVVYANFLGQPIYVINSRDKAEELLSKRGNMHSGRPQQILPRYL